MDRPDRPTVLVVDDVEAEVNMLVETLADDYEVSVAMDGESALEYLKETLPDLILLDIIMPDMDGYEVMERIKADKRASDVPLIFCTALTDSMDETRGLELGAVDYIAKPYVPSVILARVRTHLELAGARKELQRQNKILSENIELREQVEQISRHDLKSPLQAIMMAAQLLLHSQMDDETKESILYSQIASCHTILNMINRSMDLYKIEQGIYRLEARQVNALTVLDQTLRGVQGLIEALSLETDIVGPGIASKRRLCLHGVRRRNPSLFHAQQPAAERRGSIASRSDAGNFL